MSVARSSFIFSAGTLLSRVSGVLRDSIVGAVFGASVYMDAYIIAFRLPNLLRELLAEGALGSSFAKVYSALCVKDEEAAKELLVQTLALVTLVSICVTGLGIVFAWPLVKLATPSEALRDVNELRTITTGLTQLMFPFIGFASIGAVVQGALYQRGGFFLVAVAPILFNVFNIIGALWFGSVNELIFPTSVTNYFGNAAIMGLAMGTLLGGAAQAGLQLWGIWRPLLAGRRLWPTSFPWSKDIQKIVVLMSPMVIAASSGQINGFVNTNFAAGLQTGAVLWITNAFRLIQLPIGMFGVAIGAAVLPALVKSITTAGGKLDKQSSSEAINALDLITWLMLPCLIFLQGSALDLTRFLYQAGKFSEADSQATAIAIQAYSWGLIGYGLLKVLNSYYYAVDRTRFPMMVSLLSIGINYAGNALLVNKYGHQGLAMTASITLSLNAFLLLIGMSRDGIQIDKKQVATSIGLLCSATAAVAVLRYFYVEPLSHFSVMMFVKTPTGTFSTKMDSAFRLAFDGICVLSVFGSIGLTRIGMTPKEAMRALKRRKSSR